MQTHTYTHTHTHTHTHTVAIHFSVVGIEQAECGLCSGGHYLVVGGKDTHSLENRHTGTNTQKMEGLQSNLMWLREE